MKISVGEGVRLRLVPEAAVAPGPQPGPAAALPRLSGRSPGMRALQMLAGRVAGRSTSVLITGETGVGKEVLAETVHRLSPRASGPFVPVNCAAVSESLADAELFGHERGAFTGAVGARMGLLEAASGGTVFLDEIGEMSLAVQTKLLRVLETRQVLRLGAQRTRPLDFRLVAATNRDLDLAVRQGRFRADLLFRLDVVRLEIPPLRERTDEIEPLARAFLAECAGRAAQPPPSLSPEALAVLTGHDWPGNIRELRNVIERASLLCTGDVVGPQHLPIRRHIAAREVPPSPPIATLQQQLEREAMVDALARCHGNQTRAAALLGMPRRTFCKRLVAHSIPRPRAAPKAR